MDKEKIKYLLEKDKNWCETNNGERNAVPAEYFIELLSALLAKKNTGELPPAPQKNMDKKIFIGMHRPMWETVTGGGYIQCTCGSMLQIVQDVREHWQEGHFDTPIYKNENAECKHDFTRLFLKDPLRRRCRICNKLDITNPHTGEVSDFKPTDEEFYELAKQYS